MNGRHKTQSLPPKRQRMLEMILALGGLKEAEAIPPGKVSEALEQLRRELVPLLEPVLSFPDQYYTEFLDVIERTAILDQVTDESIVRDAISSIESVALDDRSEDVGRLLSLLQSALSESVHEGPTSPTERAPNIVGALQEIAVLVDEIAGAVSNFEEAARHTAQEAAASLGSLVSSFEEIRSVVDESAASALERIAKLGTSLRYGPLMRAVAQIRRAHADGRIDDARLSQLVSQNIVHELIRGLILFVLRQIGPQTVVRIAELLHLPPAEVQGAIVSMIDRAEVEIVAVEDSSPVFSRVLPRTPASTVILKQAVQQLRGAVKLFDDDTRQMIDDDTRQMIDDSLQRMTALLERLQLLGEFDESVLSESVTRLRELVSSVLESALKQASSQNMEDLQLLIAAGLEAFARFRLKIALEKGPSLVTGTNVYGERLDPQVYERLMDTYLENELERGTILVLIRKLGAMTAADLAQRTGIPQDRVFRHLLQMKRAELLTIAGERDGYVLYDVPHVPSEVEIALGTVCGLIPELERASHEVKQIVDNLRAEDIGRLASALDVFSRACDHLKKVTIGGTVVGESILTAVEPKVRSAVGITLRTRAKLPTTRPKVTVDELDAVDVPSVLDEYKSMMGYAPLVGFGTVNWDQSKCLGCKSCEIACPEDAIYLRPVFDIDKVIVMSEEQLARLPVQRALFYQLIRKLAATRPSEPITLQNDIPGIGHVQVDLHLCIGCRTCVRRCPGPEDGALELELKWTLPEVVRQLTALSPTE